MKRDICKLCDTEKDLAESHIIPKFVYRWMKNTGGKYFREPLNPNKRFQDGKKNYLLCFNCEQKFSKYEKWFADNVFFPHLSHNLRFLEYDENLGNFIVSILWRRLLLCKIESKEYFEETFHEWKSYLNTGSPIPSGRIHFITFGDSWGKDSQPNEFVHRYFTRATDINIVDIDGNVIVFAKFSRFLVFAELNSSEQNFRGTDIHFVKGRLPFAQFIDNSKISQYFVGRAEEIFSLALSRISENEQQKILTEITKDFNKFWLSDAGKTLFADINNEIRPYEADDKMSYVCDVCLASLKEPHGHLLRTYELIQSENYWRYAFNQNDFGIDKEGLNNRINYFKEISSSITPWVICDECISMFNLEDQVRNKIMMQQWTFTKGKFLPEKHEDFRLYLNENEIKRIAEIIVSVR